MIKDRDKLKSVLYVARPLAEFMENSALYQDLERAQTFVLSALGVDFRTSLVYDLLSPQIEKVLHSDHYWAMITNLSCVKAAKHPYEASINKISRIHSK